MTLDVALVARISGGGEHDLLAGQPAVGEVGAEGERPRLVVAAVPFSGELRCQPFGVGSVGAGGVPAPPLPAGDGVGALIDDRVPAVALPRDVALHEDPPLGLDGRDAVEGSVEGPVC